MSIEFAPLSKEDFMKLQQWLNIPHVNSWYGESKNWTLEMVLDKYSSYCDGLKLELGEMKPIHAFIIHYDEQPIGYIQYYNAYDFLRDGYQLKSLPKSLAAVDMFIGEEKYRGKGIGSKAIELFLNAHAFKDFDYAFVDPESSNLAAIKTYSQVGFKACDDQISESMQLMIKPKKIFDEIESLEKKLLASSARKSVNTLDELLVDDFKEFGKSGLVYNKRDILSRLPEEEPREFNAKYFEVIQLDSCAFLITYTTIESDVSVLRSSIWKSIDGHLQMVFHQGTEIRGIE